MQWQALVFHRKHIAKPLEMDTANASIESPKAMTPTYESHNLKPIFRYKRAEDIAKQIIRG